jgi:hypothetical protein
LLFLTLMLALGKQCNAKVTLKNVKTGGGDIYCESHDPARFAKNA